jgi:two-component system CheB/CheR fusion protein
LFLSDGVVAPDHSLLDDFAWHGADLANRLRAVFASGIPLVDLELEHHTKARETRLYQLSATPIANEQQSLLLVALVDITARRRLEELRKAAEVQRDSFVASVSDELRMPLTAILLWVDVLRDLEREDPQHAVAIDTIADCARNESRLVDDLLDLAMSASGELALDTIELDPASSVRSVVESMRSVADARKLALTTELAAGARIRVDARRLQQITSKLLANALEFTPGGNSVNVALEQIGSVVEIRISDTGRGIGAEFLPKAFEPFTQEDPSSSRSHRGLGIGLALVRYLVARQAGTVHATSVEGKGTTITVRFPATTRA